MKIKIIPQRQGRLIIWNGRSILHCNADQKFWYIATYQGASRGFNDWQTAKRFALTGREN